MKYQLNLTALRCPIPLLSAKNTILTPHIAFASEQSFEKRAVILCKNLIEWENGGIDNKIV